MAEQKITVEFDSRSVDALQRALKSAFKAVADQARLTVGTPLVEPIKLTVPIERRKNQATPQRTEDLFLFFDSDNQEHWVSQAVGDDHPVWRQAFFLPRS
jgi:hypothetical protein